MSRVLAVDYGRARAGCAISDPTGTLATPLPVVERPPTRRGIARIVRVARERGAERMVVGLPLTLAGTEGHQAQETRAFAQRLEQAAGLPVELHDERLTTRQAERSGAGGANADEDSRAAAHLLESWLSRRGAGAR